MDFLHLHVVFPNEKNVSEQDLFPSSGEAVESQPTYCVP